MLGALRHRNYRLFLTGQIVSTIGTWMQSVAMPWLALQLTHSGLLVGLVLAVQFTPVLLGSQLGGVPRCVTISFLLPLMLFARNRKSRFVLARTGAYNGTTAPLAPCT